MEKMPNLPVNSEKKIKYFPNRLVLNYASLILNKRSKSRFRGNNLNFLLFYTPQPRLGFFVWDQQSVIRKKPILELLWCDNLIPRVHPLFLPRKREGPVYEVDASGNGMENFFCSLHKIFQKIAQ